MSILGKHRDHCSSGLLQRYRDGPAAKALCQLRGPDLDGLRGVVDFAALQFAIRGSHRPKVFSIGPIDADVRCEF